MEFRPNAIVFCPNRFVHTFAHRATCAFVMCTDHAGADRREIQYERISPFELHLYFYDIDLQRFSHESLAHMAMTKEHALQLWRFIDEIPSTVTTLVLSCEAGVSRSKSIGLAVRDALRLTASVVREALSQKIARRDFYNAHVYQTTIQGYANFIAIENVSRNRTTIAGASIF